MRRRPTFVIAVLAIALPACTPHPVPPSVARGERARAERGSFELTITANDAQRDVSLVASGAFDDPQQRYTLSMRAAGLAPGWDGTVDVVQLPDATYLRCPYLDRQLGVATPWIRVDGPAGRELVDIRALLSGLVRPGTMRFDAPGEPGRASVRYVDTGAPVTIEPPPAAEVTDVTAEMSELIGRETGG